MSGGGAGNGRADFWEEHNGGVRPARHDDVPEIAAGVSQLLAELGGHPAAPQALEAAAHALLDAPEEGAAIVAEVDGRVVGLVSVSWQMAVRIPGRYGLIQELWVHPDWRHREIGAELLSALFELARERETLRLEVGLPSERFRNAVATESFYANNGFQGIGLRMRRLL